MANSNQLRADFATLEQLASDQGTHAGTVENYRETLRQHVAQAVSNFDGGMGSDEHQSVMKIADQLIDEHIQATQQFRTSTTSVNDTFRQGGQMARSILASGA